MLIVSMIDSNEWKGFKYRVKRMVGVQVNSSEKNAKNLETEEYEKNLRQIFDKNFKERSAVDARFLRYVEDCVDENINTSKKLQKDKKSERTKLNEDVAYII